MTCDIPFSVRRDIVMGRRIARGLGGIVTKHTWSPNRGNADKSDEANISPANAWRYRSYLVRKGVATQVVRVPNSRSLIKAVYTG